MTTDLFNFQDKTVLVTGAAGGIGAGIARRFAQAGANVALHYHTGQGRAEQSAAELADLGVQTATLQADLTDACQVEQMLSQALHIFTRLDILINNAGSYPLSPLLEMRPEEWESVLGSNLRSAFLCTQAAARQMATQPQRGTIINIASIEGQFPADQHAHYNAAKAGLIQFTKSAARELGALGIRVNAVSPGLINRPGLKQDWPEGVNRWQTSVPLARLGEPEDIADACLFLASPLARWITGVNLPVDGGASTTPAF